MNFEHSNPYIMTPAVVLQIIVIRYGKDIEGDEFLLVRMSAQLIS